MKKKVKLELGKFKIARLKNPRLIVGGTGERTNKNDPECGEMRVTDNTQCGDNS